MAHLEVRHLEWVGEGCGRREELHPHMFRKRENKVDQRRNGAWNIEIG